VVRDDGDQRAVPARRGTPIGGVHIGECARPRAGATVVP
jgi:hypothetical protein